MAVEVASAYIALYAKMPGIKNDITKALGGSAVQAAVGKSGESMGSKLMDGMNKIGKVGAIAVGGAIAAGVGTALVKGFQRLDALDQATSKLTGLGHSAKTVQTIMDNALASVRGTAFGMGEAATTAAGAVAAGIKPGKELERTLKAVADASTIAGTDMGSMGAIFNKVAASNKVQMDVINQLHDAGVPALALLADQMGVTAEEASKMASKGKIDFETFQAAMESGMGGAALESGKTFSGAMDNVMAALGRMGANLLSGIFPDMKDGLSGLLEAMEPLEAVAKDVGKGIADAFTWIRDNWTFLEPFAIAIGVVTGALIALNVVMTILSMNPIVLAITAIIIAVGLLIAAIILLVQNWDEVVAFIIELNKNFALWMRDIIGGFALWLRSIWIEFANFINDIWQGIVDGVTGYVNMMRTTVMNVVGAIVTHWNDAWTRVSSFFTSTWRNIVSAVELVRDAFKAAFSAIKGFIVGAFESAVRTVKNAINGIIGLINGAIRGINGMIGTVGGAFGLEVSIPQIPRLANGALIGSSRGGSIVNIGEGRYDEAVMPLGGPQLERIKSALGGGDAVELRLMQILEELQDARRKPTYSILAASDEELSQHVDNGRLSRSFSGGY